MNKRILLLAMLSVLLVASVSSVYAVKRYSAIYTTFNATETTYKALDENYTTVVLEVCNKLTYSAVHETESLLKAHVFLVNSTDLPMGIKLMFYNNTVFDIYYKVVEDEVKIGDGFWNETAVEVRIRDGEVTVYDSKSEKVIEGFGMDATIGQLGFSGGVDFTTSGYVQICVSTYGTSGSDYMGIMTEWMPIIVQFMMLGIVMGLLKKFSKW